MTYDGSIVFKTGLDNKELEKEITSTRKKIQTIKEQIYKSEAQKLPLLEQSKQLSVELDKANAKLQQMRTAPIGTFSEDAIREQQQRVSGLTSQYNAVENRIDSINRSLEKSNISLDMEEKRAGFLEIELAKSAANADKINKNTKKSSKAMEEMNRRTRRFGNRLREIAIGALFFNLISTGLRSMVDWFGKSIKSSDQAKAAIAKLKGALLTLAQPILQVVIPAFTTLVNVLARIVTAIATFVAALFGTTIEGAADAAESLYNEANAMNTVSGAAKQAQKNLSGLDEINVYQKNTGGGGGSGNTSNEIAPDFNIGEGGLLSGLLDFTLSDILFKWENLTADDVIGKVLAGLNAIAGAYIGFKIGGVGGAIIGAIAGVAISALVTSLLFENDGKISNKELGNLLAAALGGLVGAAIGVAAGGPAGAIIGFSIGASVTLGIAALSAYLDDPTGAKTALQEKINGLIKDGVEARVRISNLTGEIDSETMMNLNVAEKLIDRIFEIDAKDNQTAGELAEIQTLIGELNELPLDGLQGQFSVTKDGYIIPTRQEAEKLLDTIEQSYKIEAFGEALKEAYVEEYEASQRLEESTNELKDAKMRLNLAQTDYNKSLENLNLLYENGSIDEQIYATEMAKITSKLGEAKTAVKDCQTAVDENASAMKEAGDQAKTLSKKIRDVTSNMDEQANAAENAGRATGDSYTKGMDEATEKAPEVAKTAGEDTVENFDKSEESKETGAENIASYTEGMESETETAASTAADLAEQTEKALDSSQAAYNAGKSIPDEMAKGITEKSGLVQSATKTMLNACSSLIQKFCNNSISAISSSISKTITQLNSMRVTNGQASYSRAVANVKIPMLAQGAVIPPNREFMAVLGDQRSGTNLETPEKLLRQIMREELGNGRGSNTYNISAVADGRVILRLILEEGKAMQMASGRNPFALEV